MRLPHGPRLAEAFYAEAQRPPAQPGVDGVQRFHQPPRPLAVARIEQRPLPPVGRRQREQHHAGFFVAMALAVDRGQPAQRLADQRAGVRRGRGELDGAGAVVGRLVGVERIGADEHLNPARLGALPAQPDRRASDVKGDGLFQLLQGRDRFPERARGDDLPLGRRDFFERETGNPPQLVDDPLHHRAKGQAQQRRVGLAQPEGRVDAERFEPGRPAPGDAPEVGRFQVGQRLGLPVPRQQRHRAAGDFPFLGDPVGDLGEHFRGADADRDRQAEPLSDRFHDPPRVVQRCRFREIRQTEKRLVDGVDFQVRGKLTQHGHQPRGKVAVQGVVGREDPRAVPPEQLADVADRRPHRDAQRLDLLGAGHHAAVVVGQHRDRSPLQRRGEGPLAGHVKVVGVDQGEDGRPRGRG